MDKYLSTPKEKKVVIEIDDVTTDRWRECRQYVYRLKEIYPQLKVTLWCIPAFCTYHLISEIEEKEWIEWGWHGNLHWRKDDGKVEKTGGECDRWSYGDIEEFISQNMWKYAKNFNHGFKAPWYYIKGESLKWFRDNNWFVCIHPIYTTGIPKGLKVYEFTKHKGSLRLHIQDSHFDGVRENFERLKGAFNNDTQFEFVSENLSVR